MAQAQVGEVFVAKSHVQRVARAEVRKHRVTKEVLAGVIAHVRKEFDGKIAKLEARVSEVKFVGQWTEGRQYSRGNFVSHGGSVHHCNVDGTKSKPGHLRGLDVSSSPRPRWTRRQVRSNRDDAR